MCRGQPFIFDHFVSWTEFFWVCVCVCVFVCVCVSVCVCVCVLGFFWFQTPDVSPTSVHGEFCIVWCGMGANANHMNLSFIVHLCVVAAYTIASEPNTHPTHTTCKQ